MWLIPLVIELLGRFDKMFQLGQIDQWHNWAQRDMQGVVMKSGRCQGWFTWIIMVPACCLRLQTGAVCNFSAQDQACSSRRLVIAYSNLVMLPVLRLVVMVTTYSNN